MQDITNTNDETKQEQEKNEEVLDSKNISTYEALQQLENKQEASLEPIVVDKASIYPNNVLDVTENISSVVKELINANLFNDKPDESISKMLLDATTRSKQICETIDTKLKNIPLEGVEDYILNGKIYTDLLKNSIDANSQQIDAVNAIAKFVPKQTSTRVNVGQQVNSNIDNPNGISSSQFIEIIKTSERAGINPIEQMRLIEDDMDDKSQDGDGEEEDFLDAEQEEEIHIINSPSVDDF